MNIKEDKSMEQLILEKAEELFLEKGFAATSTTMIARAVGCNQALVHYYFRTKDKLFNTVFETRFRDFLPEYLTLRRFIRKVLSKKSNILVFHISICWLKIRNYQCLF